MEINELPQIILTLTVIALLLGVGLIVLTEFGAAARTDAAATDDAFTGSNTTAVTLTNGYITTTTAVFTNNGTISIPANNFQFDSIGKYKGTTVLLLNDSLEGQSFNVSYTYGASTDTSTALGGTVTGLDDFVSWFPVIIVVLAAGIILFLVTKSFKQ